jgi:tetratricopeptide (TPR) repeat protein
MNEFLNTHFNQRTPEQAQAELDLPYDPVEEAQELMFQVMESDHSEEMLLLTQRALALDPENVDAKLTMAMVQSGSQEEEVRRTREIIRRAEQVFGEEFMRETEGHFYGDVMTRPYMRAQQALFDLLISGEDFDEAIAQGERMLQLNPNDNQAIRDTLLALYLHTGNCAAARDLMKRYKETITAVQSWFLPLERFLSNNRKGAKDALKRAFRTNPYVLEYLLGVKEPPQQQPSHYRLGEESEALCVIDILALGWWQHDGAIKWLVSMLVRGEIKPDFPPSEKHRLRY